MATTIGFRVKGQGDLVSRLIMERSRNTFWVTGVINPFTKSL